MDKNIFMKDEGQEHRFKIPKRYEVDFDKINSIADVLVLVEVLFKGLNIAIQEDSEYFEHLKYCLKEVERL